VRPYPSASKSPVFRETIQTRRPAAARALALLPAALALVLAGCTPVTYVVQPREQYVQGPPPAPTYVEAPPAPAPAAPDPLDQLMAPIALYPDPLISIILPASTFPSDVASAGAYLNGGGDPAQAGSQPWDPSVRSLAHYPDVAKWMAQNPTWTQAVGAAFVAEPAQVMKAIQRLRALAQADGTLVTTPQQQVVASATYIEIVPAQPDVIYVPVYNPSVVFVDQPYYEYNGPFLSYGPPYDAGVWLTFGCNWHGGGVLVVDQGYWRGGSGGWRTHDQASFAVSVNVRVWGYPAGRPRPQAPSGWRTNPQVVSVRPIGGAPQRPPQSAFRNIHTQGPAAVAVVSRNPQAFKGRPINTAILQRPAGQAPQRAQAQPRPPNAAGAKAPPPRPAAAAAPEKAVSRPAAPGQEPRADLARTPQGAENERTAGPEADPRNPAGKKPDPKKVVKTPPPKPKPEKPPEDPPH
jgi:hypothetical protein